MAHGKGKMKGDYKSKGKSEESKGKGMNKEDNKGRMTARERFKEMLKSKKYKNKKYSK